MWNLEKWYACCVLSCFGRVLLFVTLWTVGCQAPFFMGFSRQKYFAIPSSRGSSLTQELDLCLMSPALAGVFFTTSTI